MRILMHAIAVIRPRGGPFDADIDGDVARTVLGFLDYLPAPTRLSFPIGLRLLEYGPFLFQEGFRRFSTMDEATAARYLHHWERAGSAPSMLYQGVRALVLVCFYQHPKILEAMEVDWQGRADERVRYRARVLRAMTATATSPPARSIASEAVEPDAGAMPAASATPIPQATQTPPSTGPTDTSPSSEATPPKPRARTRASRPKPASVAETTDE
jgi:hypothetical protein